MINFKEIISGIRSCFALTPNERMVILLITAILLVGLGMRWRHLSRERSDPVLNESRSVHPEPENNALRK
jgi:hypothetical protein